MGRKFVLLGDIGTDHEGFPATTVISGSSTVLMDGKPIARLGDQLAMHAKPHHPPHPRNVFGFSRGAALARHFVNLINQWPESVILPVVETPSLMDPIIRFEEIAAFPPEVKAKVGFVGLFDTVGSFYWPGDDSELDFNLDLAADSADRVVQLTAFHEIRKNFPLTSIAGPNGQLPGNFTEKALPGAHSDVGGGYENPSVDIRNYETFTVKTYQGLGMNGRTIRSAQQKVAALNAQDPRNIQMRVRGTDVIAANARKSWFVKAGLSLLLMLLVTACFGEPERYRFTVAVAGGPAGWPVWVEDVTFDDSWGMSGGFIGAGIEKKPPRSLRGRNRARRARPTLRLFWRSFEAHSGSM